MSKEFKHWQEIVYEYLDLYEGKFVVHTETAVLFSDDDMLVAENWIQLNRNKFQEALRLFLVPKHFGSVRLRMLKIKSLSAGEWSPTYPIKFILDDNSIIELEMLVDSGADTTYIPKKVGERLGLTRAKHESTFTAYGVGSEVSYLVREMPIQIDDKSLTIRLLWGQDDSISDVLLGRLDVFDKFDVLFSQKNKKITFTPIEEV
jgi:predicted aspartyl protease